MQLVPVPTALVAGPEGRDRRRLVAYLRAAPVVLAARSTVPDRHDAAGEPIPISFRTDGAWVFSNEVVAYLERYGHPLPADLEDRARAWRGGAVVVDEAGIAAAQELLLGARNS